MADKSRQSKCSKQLVAAIDFGTAYSGYAYSFKTDWLKVNINKWSGGEQISFKAPSSLLLNPDESFNSFGFEAETNYALLIAEEDEECQKYFFFHRFKMILMTVMQRRVHRKTQCIAENGKSVDAMKIFTMCISYMKNHLLKVLQNSISDHISMEHIDFVLTVPAIWDETAKMFMHEAAEKAGIKRDQLHIALEPEAASIYCQLMHLESEDNSRFFLAGNERDAKYMVLDLGGGTADITVHQLKKNGTLAELVPASGGEWGGTCIDKAFSNFLGELLGKDVMETFKTHPEYIEDYFDFWKSFEIKKRSFKFNKKQAENEKDSEEDPIFYIRFPVALVEIVGKHTNQNIKNVLQEIIRKSRFRNDLKCEYGKLLIKHSFFKKMFDPTVEMLIDHLTDLVQTIKDLRVILMVGGFSECNLVHEAVQAKFEDKCRVVIPNQAGLAVLKGAVYSGHQPDLITERVARYTYGIQTWPKFDKTEHMKSKLVMMGNEERCRDVFFPFVTKGERIKPGDKKSYIFEALNPGEGVLECGVFISNEENPKYVDEMSCVRLGLLNVPLQGVGVDGSLEIEESLIFGHTELQVTVCNFQTKNKYSVTFDLLSPQTSFPDK